MSITLEQHARNVVERLESALKSARIVLTDICMEEAREAVSSASPDLSEWVVVDKNKTHHLVADEEQGRAFIRRLVFPDEASLWRREWFRQPDGNSGGSVASE